MVASPPRVLSSLYKVVAYITAYEDAEALNACIAAIKAQSFPFSKSLWLITPISPWRLLPPILPMQRSWSGSIPKISELPEDWS